MITLVRAHGRPRDRQGLAEGGPAPGLKIARGRLIAELAAIVGPGRLKLVAAIRSGQHKRCGLALLPGQVVHLGQVDSGVDDMEWAYRQIGELDVVVRIEARERMRVALRVARAEIGAHEPVAVEHVKREHVDIEPPRQQSDQGEQQQHRQPGWGPRVEDRVQYLRVVEKRQRLGARDLHDRTQRHDFFVRVLAAQVEPSDQPDVDAERECEQQPGHENVRRHFRGEIEPPVVALSARGLALPEHDAAHRGHDPGEAQTLDPALREEDRERAIDRYGAEHEPSNRAREQPCAEPAPPLALLFAKLAADEPDQQDRRDTEHAQQDRHAPHSPVPDQRLAHVAGLQRLADEAEQPNADSERNEQPDQHDRRAPVRPFRVALASTGNTVLDQQPGNQPYDAEYEHGFEKRGPCARRGLSLRRRGCAGNGR